MEALRKEIKYGNCTDIENYFKNGKAPAGGIEAPWELNPIPPKGYAVQNLHNYIDGRNLPYQSYTLVKLPTATAGIVKHGKGKRKKNKR